MQACGVCGSIEENEGGEDEESKYYEVGELQKFVWKDIKKGASLRG